MRSFSRALSNGTGQELGFALDEKVSGGGIEVDDETVCCNALYTSVNRRKLSGASVWGRTPGNYRLFFAWTVVDSVGVDVAMFSSDPCTLGFYFWPGG